MSHRPSAHLPAVTRRTLLGGAAGVTLGAPLVSSAAAASSAIPAPTGGRIRGADLSFTRQLERAGVRFTSDGRAAPVERLLRRAGCNWNRVRVWVDPPHGYSTLRDAVVLARRARGASERVLLDLHYSDFWADPAHQTTPRRWQGLDLEQLADRVRGYTRHALRELDRAGAPVSMVQIGNEITAGMLWPLGQVYAGDEPDWDGFVTLLQAGIDGARTAGVSVQPEVMVHIDRGGDTAGTRWFFDHVIERGVDPDVIGLSYYPFWHGPLSALQATLTDAQAAYDRDLVVVETAYPWTLDNGDDLENLVTSASQLPEGERFPATPQGQADYYTALRAVLDGVPGGRGRGFFVWEPEWVPGVGWEPGQGNPNDNLTLFDFSGDALPAVAVAFAPS